MARHLLLYGQIDYLTMKEKHHEKTHYCSNCSPYRTVPHHYCLCSDSNPEQVWHSYSDQIRYLCEVGLQSLKKATCSCEGVGGFFLDVTHPVCTEPITLNERS